MSGPQPGRSPGPPARGGRLTAINGALALMAVLLVVQMWLLTAALEAFLAGHAETALPAAIVSGVLFSAAVGLVLFVERVDRENPKAAARQPSSRQ